MIVITMTNCPPRLRGDLSKWLLEINTGVYVGQVNGRVREALWDRVCKNIGPGQASMVYSTNNEQRMDFRVYNTIRRPVDCDGLKLIQYPAPDAPSQDGEAAQGGFSKAAKRRMGMKRSRRKKKRDSYLVVGIETDGISSERNHILEIGVLAVEQGKPAREFGWLISAGVPVPDDITELTGITDEMLAQQGVPLKDALQEFYELVNGQEAAYYQASFDLMFLEQAFESCGSEMPDQHVVDVLGLAKSSVRGLPNYKLATLCEYLGVAVQNSHRALADCRLTYEVLEKLDEDGRV